MDYFTTIIPIIISIAAFIVSIMNYLNDRTKIISNVVTADRIKWISDVRNLTTLFLEKYIKGAEKDELKIIKSQIDLYIVYEKDYYKKFDEKLNYCIVNAYTDEDYRDLVSEIQIVLNKAWVRVKDEAGITKRTENRINKSINKK